MSAERGQEQAAGMNVGMIMNKLHLFICDVIRPSVYNNTKNFRPEISSV